MPIRRQISTAVPCPSEFPSPGARIRIVDPVDGRDLEPGEAGEIVVAGPMVVPGYWQLPDESAHAIRDGWLHTGDLGKMTEDGWLFVVDRIKDLINAGGYKVVPRDVEDVLYRHPAVREASVVGGVPDEYRGETVKAFVSLVPGATVGEDELIAFCRDRMAAYKYPRSVVVLDELPQKRQRQTVAPGTAPWVSRRPMAATAAANRHARRQNP